MPEFLAIVLSTYGLSWLLVEGIGPGGILSRMRFALGVRRENETRYGLTWIGDLFNCTVCMSVWVSVPMTILVFLAGWGWAAPMAAVGLVALVREALDM